jgi:uncharacterized protein (TIGR00730 family)
MSAADNQALEVAVLGSARLGEQDSRWGLAQRLGELLAEEGYVVVTGGYGGLMAAVSRGAHARGGRVIGLPMRHWTGVEPNLWNAELRWSTGYGARIDHVLRCSAAIALPGGVGTLSELAMVWAASQTEEPSMPLILLGDCWPPLLRAIRRQLVVGDADIGLLRCVAGPQEALRELRAGLAERGRGGPRPGPRG